MFNNVPDLTGAIHKLIEENNALKKEVESFSQEKAANMAKQLSGKAESINGIKVIKINGTQEMSMVKNIASILQKEESNLVLTGAFESDGKPQLVLMYTNDLVSKGKNAGKDVREAAKLIQGGGGGQPGIASAGGKDITALSKALEKMIELATA